MTAYPVGSTPNLISGTFSDPYMIRNASSVPIYLGNDSSLTPDTRAITLDAGAAFMYPGSVELWAVTDPGNTGVIELMYGANGSFIPGPSSVGISGPVQNRPQNNPDLLATSVNPWTGPIGSPQMIAAIPTLDISSYASLIININDNANGLALSTGSMVSLAVVQYANGIEVSRYTPQWLIGMCDSRLQIPVVGTQVVVTGTFIASGTGGGPGTIALTIQAIGSHQVISAPDYVSYNPGAMGNIPLGGYYDKQLTTVTSVTEFANSVNGPANFSLIPSATGATGNGNVLAVEYVGPRIAYLVGLAPSGNTGVSQSVILPMRPIQVLTRATAGGMFSSLQQ